MAKIKVLLVDDSAVVRQVIQEILAQDKEIEVVGAVADPIFALARMEKAWPDVIVLDVEMPRMDGVTFLRKIMQERPTPVVMCSSLTEKGAQITMQALAAGAVAIVTKPTLVLRDNLAGAIADELIQGIKAAAAANPRRLLRNDPVVAAPKLSADAVLGSGPQTALHRTTEQVVVIGTSTGGTQALEAVLRALPRTVPGIAIVQHMPEKFTAAFAQRLDSVCLMEVKEAENGDRLLAGRALIAPGGRHMLLRRSGGQYLVEVKPGPPVNRHCPSVDVLFRSAAQACGRNALGIIMTGMGDDGARGLKEMHEVGARTIAEDESTCVVFGMPKEAIRLGAADRVLPLDRIPQEIVAFSR
jgi:two-component system chemotaxis response regulator CheB